MRIHDCDMAFHFLYFDEPVQPPFKEYFMDTGDSFCLCKKECEGRLEICRKSWKNPCLKIGRTETTSRIVDDDRIIIWSVKSYPGILTFSEKCSQILYSRSFDTDRWLSRQGSQYDESPTFYVVMYHCGFSMTSVDLRSVDCDIVLIVDLYRDSE